MAVEGALIKWTRTGLELADDLTWQQCRGILAGFKMFEDLGTLGLSDVLTFARSKGWLEQAELALTDMHFDMASVKKALAVADVPRALRHPSLTAEHYYVVSGLLYEEQIRWLDLALKHEVSPLVLKRSIEVGKLLSAADLAQMSGAGSGILNYHGILTSWERWEKKVGGLDGILHWPVRIRQQWLDDVKVVRELADKVEDSLK